MSFTARLGAVIVAVSSPGRSRVWTLILLAVLTSYWFPILWVVVTVPSLVALPQWLLLLAWPAVVAVHAAYLLASLRCHRRWVDAQRMEEAL